MEDFQNPPYGNADLANCTKVGLGQYEVSIEPGGTFTSNPYPLVVPAGKFLILTDFYTLTETDVPSDYYKRNYNDQGIDISIGVLVDFTGVVPVNGYQPGLAYTLAPALQGNSLVIQVTNGLPQTLYMSGWSLLYAAP